MNYTELSAAFVASDIHQWAAENQSDLIVMAGGGRSRLSNIILGSETEQMAQLEHQLPLLIIKTEKRLCKVVGPGQSQLKLSDVAGKDPESA